MAAKRGRDAAPSPKSALKPSRVGRVQLSSWQVPDAVRQLRILAAEEGTSMQALMADALNLLFAKHGKPRIAEP